MNKVPELIYDICPSCNPRTFVKTKARFTGEVESCGGHIEYLYQCVDCGAKLWVYEEWAKTHEVLISEDSETCCMCGQVSEELIARKNGDHFCRDCHEEHCEHNQSETIPVANGYETITICHECGCEI